MSRPVAAVVACGPLTLAFLGLFAWATGSLRLASFGDSYIPMAPSTAIGFVLVSVPVIALSIASRAIVPATAQAAAALLALLASVKLVEFFTGASALNLEAALVSPPGAFGVVPLARMSPLTAVLFLFSGLSLAALAGTRWQRGRDAGGFLATGVGLAGSTVVLGYVYGAPLLYGGRIIPMALTTGLAFIGTGAALIALAGAEASPLRWFCGGSARARLLRVFLPVTVCAVLGTGMLTNALLANVRANPALVAAACALVSAGAVGFAVTWLAQSLGATLDAAEATLRQSRDELERRVQERTAELSALNTELESFSYSVSHDLRAPLRHVIGFAALLEKGAGSALDQQHRRYLITIIEAAQRMGQLIDDLLEFSRTARRVPNPRIINLGQLVREARTEVAAHAGPREIVWRVGDSFPYIKADPALLRLALVNLLSNAVKYTARQAVAEIEVGTSPGVNGEVVLFVKDNGVGFDMTYATKLFGVFQRLHSEAEFEGTGIGLANVNRIVQRHGGRVWAEAEVGCGATFYVALPAQAG